MYSKWQQNFLQVAILLEEMQKRGYNYALYTYAAPCIIIHIWRGLNKQTSIVYVCC